MQLVMAVTTAASVHWAHISVRRGPLPATHACLYLTQHISSFLFKNNHYAVRIPCFAMPVLPCLYCQTCIYDVCLFSQMQIRHCQLLLIASFAILVLPAFAQDQTHACSSDACQLPGPIIQCGVYDISQIQTYSTVQTDGSTTLVPIDRTPKTCHTTMPNMRQPTAQLTARSYLCYAITECIVLLITFSPLGDLTKSRTGCFREEKLGSPRAPVHNL